MAILSSTQIMLVDTAANLPSTATAGQFAFALDTQQSYIWNSTAWVATAKVGVKKSTVTVSGLVTGVTAIYTLEASTINFYPTQLVPRVVSISGVTTPPSISIGSNATSYNNIATSSLLSSLMSTLGTNNGVPQVTNYSPALAGGTVIYANVGTAAIATAYSVKYDILGFYDV